MTALTNPDIDEEREYSIVFIEEPNHNGQRVGVESLTPSPPLLGLEFADGLVATGTGATV
jgi:hypothetical protein